MSDVNILAVLVAALMTFLLGGLWYSPALFGRTWGREAGYSEEAIQAAREKKGPKHPAQVFGLSFALMVIAAYVLALYLGPAPALASAVATGAKVGACFVAASFGVNYAFASRSFKLWLIDGGYHAVQFTLFGLVLGLWH